MSQGLHAVQQQDARKNYIGIVNERTEEERAADCAAPQPPVMSYLIGRLAAVLKRSRRGAPGHSLTS